MSERTNRIARLSMMVALMLVLGWLDRAIPLGSILGEGFPG